MWALKPTSWLLLHGEGELKFIIVFRIMAAFATCAIFIKLYDWLRLFENTAFYVLLVKLTMKDILPFMILLFVSLLIFGIPMSMLSLNRDES